MKWNEMRDKLTTWGREVERGARAARQQFKQCWSWTENYKEWSHRVWPSPGWHLSTTRAENEYSCSGVRRGKLRGAVGVHICLFIDQIFLTDLLTNKDILWCPRRPQNLTLTFFPKIFSTQGVNNINLASADLTYTYNTWMSSEAQSHQTSNWANSSSLVLCVFLVNRPLGKGCP